MIITIDGPSASGKSTVGRILAHRLGYYYLSSGILYRAVAYLLVNNFLYTKDTIINPSREHLYACLDREKFFYEYSNGHHGRVFFNNIDITPHLKDALIDTMASLISAHQVVRNVITDLQQKIAADYNLVIEGRDVGSVVFPCAELKIFLTASIDVRAQRWRDEQEKRGNIFSYQEAVESITGRDKRDAQRTVAPLVIPEDAIVVDTSGFSVDETVEKIMLYVHRCLKI